MDVARQHFLADAAFAGDQDRGFGAGDLVGQLDHRAIASSRSTSSRDVVGDGRQDGGDQLGVGRQRDEFLGAGADGGDRGAGVGADAAGHHRDVDALGLEPHHQGADVEVDVDHQQVGALAAAQQRHRLLDAPRHG